MVKIVAVMLLGLCLWAGNALAQDAKDALGEAMARDPDRFQADMVDLIAGFLFGILVGHGPQGRALRAWKSGTYRHN